MSHDPLAALQASVDTFEQTRQPTRRRTRPRQRKSRPRTAAAIRWGGFGLFVSGNAFLVWCWFNQPLVRDWLAGVGLM